MNNSEEKEVSDSGVSENNSKIKSSRIRPRKRKRQDSATSSDVDDNLPDNILETEKNLHALAIKNNLDDVSVKKILKKVVTNDHVLALVKLREEAEDSGTEESLLPKLTRAKAKELMKTSPSVAPWNLELTPIKHIPVKTRPEVTALIAQELPEDEDDDEYEPTHDESDDDHLLESCSDLDSQPRTPATPKNQKKDSPTVVKDGPFKVPQEITTPARKKLDLGEEATIALRTRSKLSLSATPIEHIESSFVPPDDLPMPDVDDLWNQFLNECLNPGSNARHEDDDELDPEYNVAADPDANDEDEETLEKSIIKISKKELNDLVTELMNVMPADVVENQLADNVQVATNPESNNLPVMDPGNNNEIHWEGKQEPTSDDEIENTKMSERITFERRNSISRISIGKTEPEDYEENLADDSAKEVPTTEVENNVPATIPMARTTSCTMTISVEERSSAVSEVEAPPSIEPPAPLRGFMAPAPVQISVEVHSSIQMSPEQVSILQQQLRQHVQLATSNFLQLFVHPVHWTYAPKYKEYVETFQNQVISNPKSVANVCNLMPAVELMNSWATSVSENTDENKAMVEFILKEADTCRRRTASNAIYIGAFPELYKQVISNSPVFLYPYLLPPLPYRTEPTRRRFNYLKSEDELIALGLDQFWRFLEDNPKIFKPPSKPHPRRRWGLNATVQLVHKHMFPWVSDRSLLSHIKSVRKSGDKSNPIVKFLQDQTITPVKHVILPYNPKLTLYEHPETEMPRLWIRYLSQSSKRFKRAVNKPRNSVVQPPNGVEVTTGIPVEPAIKQGLPIDFIKSIPCNRMNLLPNPNKPQAHTEYDVHIVQNKENVSTNTSMLVASNLYTVVNTSNGIELRPLKIDLQGTNTVGSTNTPICSPAVTNTNMEINNVNIDKITEIPPDKDVLSNNTIIDKTVDNKQSDKAKESNHCICCKLLRKICKTKQSLITDYFKCNKEDKNRECECSNKTYPTISNKLKLLVNNYKTLSSTLYSKLQENICRTFVDEDQRTKDDSMKFNDKDFASAIAYQTKLSIRTSTVRSIATKRSVPSAFSRFNIATGDPVDLANKLYKVFDVELADMYKEFLGFLTAEQAYRIGEFQEYFIRNCVEDLLNKIREQVQDANKRRSIFEEMIPIFNSKSITPCDMCHSILCRVQDYPQLARYVFSLFPHRRQRVEKHTIKTLEKPNKEFTSIFLKSDGSKKTQNTCEETQISHEAIRDVYEETQNACEEAQTTRETTHNTCEEAQTSREEIQNKREETQNICKKTQRSNEETQPTRAETQNLCEANAPCDLTESMCEIKQNKCKETQDMCEKTLNIREEGQSVSEESEEMCGLPESMCEIKEKIYKKSQPKCEKTPTICEEGQSICEKIGETCGLPESMCEIRNNKCKVAQDMCEKTPTINEEGQSMCEEAEESCGSTESMCEIKKGKSNTRKRSLLCKKREAPCKIKKSKGKKRQRIYKKTENTRQEKEEPCNLTERMCETIRSKRKKRQRICEITENTREETEKTCNLTKSMCEIIKGKVKKKSSIICKKAEGLCEETEQACNLTENIKKSKGKKRKRISEETEETCYLTESICDVKKNTGKKRRRTIYKKAESTCEETEETSNSIESKVKEAQRMIEKTPTNCEERPSVCEKTRTVREPISSLYKIKKSPFQEINVTMDYDADNSCSDDKFEVDKDDDIEDEPTNRQLQELGESQERREAEDEEGRVQLITTIKYEPIDTSELTVTVTKVQERRSSSSDMMLFMSEDESVKVEPTDWNRDEDKLILEILKEYLTPEEMNDKTLMEIIKEKDLLSLITNSLSHKSLDEVTDRVLYLLQILVLSDYNKE